MGETVISEKTMQEILDWCYDKSMNGIPGTETAEELADYYLKHNSSISESIDSLINWQIAKAGTSGFLTNLGGLITLPVSLPANITSVIYVQLRMIAAIACMCKMDIRSDQVKTLVYVCLCGNAASDVLKRCGVEVGQHITAVAIRRLSYEVIKKINKLVGFRLITKFGQKGAINLIKLVPVVGGVIGAGFDISTTVAIGKTAKEMFYDNIE